MNCYNIVKYNSCILLLAFLSSDLSFSLKSIALYYSSIFLFYKERLSNYAYAYSKRFLAMSLFFLLAYSLLQNCLRF